MALQDCIVWHHMADCQLCLLQGNLVEVSSFAQARPAPPVPEEPRTTFNAALNFDAPAGDRPNFYMTVAAPSLAVSSPS